MFNHVFLGTNDIAPNGGAISPEATGDLFDGYVSSRRAAQPRMRILPITSIARVNDSRTAELHEYNEIIRANPWVNVIDVATMPEFDGLPTALSDIDTDNYRYPDDDTDLTHPSEAGIDLMAQYIVDRL